MSNKPTMTQAQFEAHNRKLKRQKGEPEFESESEFQREAEQWLRRAGFEPRTPASISKHHNGRWYIHLHKTKKNPIMGDLLLLDQSNGAQNTRAIEIELKNGSTALSTEQSYLYKRNEIVVCRYMEEFESAVFDWVNNG